MRCGALVVSVSAAPDNNGVVTRTTRRTLPARGIPAIEKCEVYGPEGTAPTCSIACPVSGPRGGFRGSRTDDQLLTSPRPWRLVTRSSTPAGTAFQCPLAIENGCSRQPSPNRSFTIDYSRSRAHPQHEAHLERYGARGWRQ